MLFPCTCGASAIAAAVRFDDVAFGQLLDAVLRALHVHVGLERGEQLDRRRSRRSRRPRRRCAVRASTAARPANGTNGRCGPLSARTEASPLSPTISASPCARAHARYCVWPACTTSKQPLVNTTTLPRARSASRHSDGAPRGRADRRDEVVSARHRAPSARRSRPADAVAVPSFSTTAPAAKFASRVAVADRDARRRARASAPRRPCRRRR